MFKTEIHDPYPGNDRGVGIAILGTGAAHADTLLTDEAILQNLVGYDESRKPYRLYRTQHLGTDNLHITDENCSIEDCMVKAANQALHASGKSIDEIKEIHLVTVSRTDRIAGARSTLLEKLKLDNKVIVELHHGCAGSLYALQAGRRAVLDGGGPVLVIGGDDVRNGVIDVRDCAQAGLFGAGAGAAVLGKSFNGDGLHRITTWSNREMAPFARMNPETKLFQMDGKELGCRVPIIYSDIFQYSLSKYGLTKDDVYVVPHQLNGHLIEAFRKEAGLRPDQVLNVTKSVGNMSNGSVIFALNHAVTHRLQAGSPVIFVAVGAGFDIGYGLFVPDRSLIQDSRLKVLIVDDEPDQLNTKRILYEDMLHDLGGLPDHVTVQVVTAASAEDALDYFHANHECVDFIDTDIRMTGMTGVEFISRIYEKYPRLPVIFNTAYAGQYKQDYHEVRSVTNYDLSYLDKVDIETYGPQVVEFMYQANLI